MKNSDTTSQKSVLLPWIIVGLVAVLAITASGLLIRNFSAASQNPAQQANQAQQHESAPKDSDVPEAVPVPKSKTPQVQPGNTYEFHITQWDIVVDLSAKFGSARYEINSNSEAVLSSELIDSLPEQCAGMRDGFGFKRAGENLVVVRPAQVCQAAPEIYNEIWGLLEAAVRTQRVTP